MSVDLLLNAILGTAYMVIYGILGVFLLKKSIKTGLKNLSWLSWYFLLNTSGVVFQVAWRDSGSPLFMAFLVVSFACLVPFTKYTFLQGLKSSYKMILYVVIFSTVASISVRTIRFFSPALIDATLYYLNATLTGIVVFVSTFWFVLVARDALSSIKNNVGVEPWIKKRYSIVIWSTTLLFWIAVSPFFMIYGAGFSTAGQTILIISNTLVSLVHAVTSYLCWMMPPWFKKALNGKDQKFIFQDGGEISEKELIALLGEDD